MHVGIGCSARILAVCVPVTPHVSSVSARGVALEEGVTLSTLRPAEWM